MMGITTTVRVRPDAPRRLSPDDNPTFEQWIARVNYILLRLFGVGVYDLPGYPYLDWYNRRLHPVRAGARVRNRV